MRSFSINGSTTTALWVNQGLADTGSDSISSVLKLKRVEPSESSKTPEGRRVRKNEAASAVEVEALVGSNKVLNSSPCTMDAPPDQDVKIEISPPVPMVVHCHYQPAYPTSYDQMESMEYDVEPITPYREESHHPPTTTISIAQFEHDVSAMEEAAAGLLLTLSRATE